MTPEATQSVRAGCRLWAGLWFVAPSAQEWRPALRASGTTAAALALLLLTGRSDWVAYGAFAAFAGIYGRGLRRRERLRAVLAAGASLAASILIGVALAVTHAPFPVVIAASGLLATVMAWLAERADWRPRGALFQLFALNGLAAMHGQTWASLVPAGAIALAVGALATVLAGWPASEAPPGSRRTPAPRPVTAFLPYLWSCITAGLPTYVLGIPHPSWALLSSVVPLVPATRPEGRLRGAQRLVGIGLGLVLAGPLLVVTANDHAWAVMLVPILQFGAEIFIARAYTFAMIFLTPIPLVLARLAGSESLDTMLFARGMTALIGVAAALLILTVLPIRKATP